MEYVSPIDERTQDAVAFAARDGDLSGKRVALVDITKARSAEFLDRVDVLLRERRAETFRIAKEIFSRPASTEVIEEIAIHGDLAVEGLAD
jgi:alpha-galactosidase/6-phospho-beta-glucosidase family protein